MEETPHTRIQSSLLFQIARNEAAFCKILELKVTSEGTYCSTAVVTVAQQIQSNTSTERTSVVVIIHVEFLECKNQDIHTETFQAH